MLNWGNRKTITPMTDSLVVSQILFDEKPNGVDLTTPRSVNRSQSWIGTIPKQSMEVLSGQAEVKPIKHLMTQHQYIVNATTTALLKENTYYYPGWNVFINDKLTTIDYKNKTYTGLITFNVPKGLSKIDIIFKDTLDRTAAKMISYLTVLILLLYGVYALFKKQHPTSKKISPIKKGRHS